MNTPVLRLLKRLFFPGGLFLLISFIGLQWVQLPLSFRGFAQVYPYIVLAGGIVLGWAFRRSRTVFVILALAMADQALLFAAPSPLQPLTRAGERLFGIVALLLPLNLAWLAFAEERGILTPSGLRRLALLAGQGLGVAAICALGWGWAVDWMHHPLISLPFRTSLAVAQPAGLAFVGALALMAYRFTRQPCPMAAGFIWTLLAVFLALNARGLSLRMPLSTLYLTTAGGIQVLAVLATSYTMAYRDELTGLPSRRALNEALAALGRTYVIAMVDIDHFKKFNDKFGHDVGDQVLKMVAGHLAGIQGGGRAYRYGGEEFTILFPGRQIEAMVDHLENLRKNIEYADFTVRGDDRPRRMTEATRARAGSAKRVRITVSIGMADSYNAAGRGPRHAADWPQQVIQAADKALYRAKHAGRNQISE